MNCQITDCPRLPVAIRNGYRICHEHNVEWEETLELLEDGIITVSGDPVYGWPPLGEHMREPKDHRLKSHKLEDTILSKDPGLRAYTLDRRERGIPSEVRW